MTRNVEVSVVMPVYNASKYIEEAIESVLNQTHKNFEFIIIDDGSDDGSTEMIKRYEKLDNRIIAVYRTNKGLVESLNEGIRLASSPLIARMDADDVCLEKRLEEQVAYMESNPDIDLLGTKVEVIGEYEEEYKNDIQRRFGKVVGSTESLPAMLLRENIICHPSLMIKKSALEKLNYYSQRPSEDYDLWMRAVFAGMGIQNLDKTLLKYRVHRQSKTRTENHINLCDQIHVRLEYMMAKELVDVKKDCYIWGTGAGGTLTADSLKRVVKGVRIKGFIDTYKTGTFLSKKIYSPKTAVDNTSFIFIATTKGKVEVEDFLKDNGYEPMVDFIWSV
ncbi:glycosyltransferase family 2 protein [Anoxynatronum buryatiense]|uniref:Glycosyl transferase family 2 n=1 Tax=Anoxynatronum buryatiense TaxID=489973 RepID=A0AA45WYI9_9CLOT|nr:glycosyltransferase [Anoxynatronum buryatiense]SMP67515.1 Glycosyl transferase family 2 [Anoxynatronum buryatiense]